MRKLTYLSSNIYGKKIVSGYSFGSWSKTMGQGSHSPWKTLKIWKTENLIYGPGKVLENRKKV